MSGDRSRPTSLDVAPQGVIPYALVRATNTGNHSEVFVVAADARAADAGEDRAMT